MPPVATLLRSALLGLAVVGGAAACGKSSQLVPHTGDPNDSGAGSSTTVVGGRASAGPVAAATVDVYLVSDAGAYGQALGSGTTDASGAFSVKVAADANALLAVDVHGGAYVEEASGSQVSLGSSLRAMVSAGQAASIGVTPLTEIVVQRALATAGDANSFAEAVADATFAMARATGLASITTAPADPSAPIADPNSEGAKYALLLAGLSQLAANSGVSSVQLGAALAAVFSANGTLDPGPLAHLGGGAIGSLPKALPATAWSQGLPAATEAYLGAHGHDGGLTAASVTQVTATPPLVAPAAETAPSPTGLSLADAYGGTFASGTSDRLVATGSFAAGPSRNLSAAVSWSSSNTAVAQVTPTGVVYGTAPGAAVITASLGSLQQTMALTVTSATLTGLTLADAQNGALAVGVLDPLTATASFTDNTQQDVTGQVTYQSSAPAVVTVAPRGVLVSQADGTATISASLGSSTATLAITVSNPNLTGVAVALPPGVANPNLVVGMKLQLALDGTFGGRPQQLASNANAQFVSSASDVATVSATGLVTAAAAGSAQISATYAGLAAPPMTITVAPAASVGPIATGAAQLLTGTPTSANANFTLAASTATQLTATATFSDGHTQDVTAAVTNWASKNTAAATVSASGMLTALAAGSSTVSATVSFGNARTQLVWPVVVTAATPTALALAPVVPPGQPAFPPAGAPLPAGVAFQMQAVATFSDASKQDVTGLAHWSSDTASTASISAAGLVHTAAAGAAANLTAALGRSSAVFALQTSQATLTRIALSDAAHGNVQAGASDPFWALGTFSDGTQLDVGRTVTWSVSDAGAGSISASGLFTAGPSPISSSVVATQGSVHNSLAVTVH